MITKEQIMYGVCDYFCIDYNELFMKTKVFRVTYPKQIISYLLYNRLGIRPYMIAHFLDINHSSVLSHINQIKNGSSQTKMLVEDVENHIYKRKTEIVDLLNKIDNPLKDEIIEKINKYYI